MEQRKFIVSASVYKQNDTVSGQNTNQECLWEKEVVVRYLFFFFKQFCAQLCIKEYSADYWYTNCMTLWEDDYSPSDATKLFSLY